MPLECKLNTCFYYFLSHLQVDEKAGVGWSWVFFSLQFCLTLINFQQVQLVNCFSWREVSLKKLKCSGVFRNGWLFLPLPQQEAEGVFLRYLQWESSQAQRSHNILAVPLWLDPLKFLTLRLVKTEPPAIHNYTLGFPTPELVLQWFLLLSLALESWDFLYSSVCPSHLGRQQFSIHSPLFMDSRRVGFSVCSAFYLLLGWNDNFQAYYIQNKTRLIF